MISPTYSEELEETLLWEWDVSQWQSMADTRKSDGNRAIRNDLSDIQGSLRALRSEMACLAKQSDVTTLSDRISEVRSEVDAIRNKPGFWSSLWKERGIALSLFLAILAAAGWVFSLYLDRKIEDHLKPLISDIQKVDQRLTRAEDRLNVQAASAVVQELELATIQTVKARSKELELTRKALADVKATQPTSGYWQTVSGIVRLASLALSDAATIDLNRATKLTNVDGFQNPNPGTYLLDERIANITFHDSVIVFKPGVRLKNVLFVNCVFVLPAEMANPPIPIRKLGTDLLNASDLQRVNLTTG